MAPGVLALAMWGAHAGQRPRLEPDLHGSLNRVQADLWPVARIAERVRAPALDHHHPAPVRQGELTYVPGVRASAIESGGHREWRVGLLLGVRRDDARRVNPPMGQLADDLAGGAELGFPAADLLGEHEVLAWQFRGNEYRRHGDPRNPPRPKRAGR